MGEELPTAQATQSSLNGSAVLLKGQKQTTLTYSKALKEELFDKTNRAMGEWWTPAAKDLGLDQLSAIGMSTYFSDRAFLYTRLFNALIMMAILISDLTQYGDVSEDPDAPPWLAFLTHWGLLLVTFYLLFAFFGSVYAQHLMKSMTATEISKYESWWPSALLRMRATALPVATGVVVLYWGIVYTGGPVNALGPMVHGVNLVCMFIDLVLSKQPFYILQSFGWTLLFGICYSIFFLPSLRLVPPRLRTGTAPLHLRGP
jgi:hypothetical protein